MGEDVTITLKAIDHATKQIRAVESTLKGLGGTSGRIGGVLGTVTNLFSGGLLSAGTALNLVSGAISAVGRLAGSVFHAIVGVVERVIDTVSALGSKLLWIGGILTGIAAAIAYKVGRSALDLAGWMQMTKVAFTTMLGSPKVADEWIAKFRQMAFEMPFTFRGVVEDVRSLLAYGFKIEETPRIITALSDAAAAFGGNQELFSRITMALGQIRAKGYPAGEEMRQMAQAGIPAWEILAEHIGTTIPDAMQKAENRAIDAGTAIEALVAGMEKRYGGLSKQMMNTLPGAMSNLTDVWEAAMMVLGGPIAIQATKIIKAISDTIWKLANSGALEKIGTAIASWFSTENIMRVVTFFANVYAAGVMAFEWIKTKWTQAIEWISNEENVRKVVTVFVKIYEGAKRAFDWIASAVKKLIPTLVKVFAVMAGLEVLKMSLAAATAGFSVGGLAGLALGPAAFTAVFAAGSLAIGAAVAKAAPILKELQDFKFSDLTAAPEGTNKTVDMLMGKLGAIKGVFTTAAPGVAEFVNALREALKGIEPVVKGGADPLTNALRDNTDALRAHTGGFQAVLEKVYGGGEYTRSVITRAMFGGEHGGSALSLSKIGRRKEAIEVNIHISGGSDRDRQIAEQAANETAKAFLGKLGISSNATIPAWRGATQ